MPVVSAPPTWNLAAWPRLRGRLFGLGAAVIALPGTLAWIWSNPLLPVHHVSGTIERASCRRDQVHGHRHIVYMLLDVRSAAGVHQRYKVQSPRHCPDFALVGTPSTRTLSHREDVARHARVELDVRALHDPDTCRKVEPELTPRDRWRNRTACTYAFAVQTLTVDDRKLF